MAQLTRVSGDFMRMQSAASKLPTGPPTEEVGALTQWAPGLPGWYSYVGDDLERSPQLQWPNSVLTYYQMRHDAQLQGLYNGTTLPLRRYNWMIDPNGCDPKKVAELAGDLSLPIKGSEPEPKKRYKDRFIFKKHLEDALLSLIFGHYAFEQVGEIIDGKWHLKKLAPRPPETISEILIDSVGDLYGFRQYFSSSPTMYPQVLTSNRIVWYSWMQEGANYFGRSMFRACYRNWLRKDRLLRVDAQKNERNGMGIPIAEAPAGMGGAALVRLDMLMRKLRAGDMSGGAVPNGAKVTLVGTTGSLPDTVGSIHLDNEEMARAWLAMFMQLGQTETGSRALGSEFIDFFAESVDTMADWFKDIFTEHVIEDWWDWNVDPDDDTTPLLAYTRNPDSAFVGRDFAHLVQYGAITVDMELENAIRERYGLPMREADDNPPALPAPAGSIPWPPQPGYDPQAQDNPAQPNTPQPATTSPATEASRGSQAGKREQVASAPVVSPMPVTRPPASVYPSTSEE